MVHTVSAYLFCRYFIAAGIQMEEKNCQYAPRLLCFFLTKAYAITIIHAQLFFKVCLWGWIMYGSLKQHIYRLILHFMYNSHGSTEGGGGELHKWNHGYYGTLNIKGKVVTEWSLSENYSLFMESSIWNFNTII